MTGYALGLFTGLVLGALVTIAAVRMARPHAWAFSHGDKVWMVTRHYEFSDIPDDVAPAVIVEVSRQGYVIRRESGMLDLVKNESRLIQRTEDEGKP